MEVEDRSRRKMGSEGPNRKLSYAPESLYACAKTHVHTSTLTLLFVGTEDNLLSLSVR